VEAKANIRDVDGTMSNERPRHHDPIENQAFLALEEGLPKEA
jgi:hypothetical protein